MYFHSQNGELFLLYVYFSCFYFNRLVPGSFGHKRQKKIPPKSHLLLYKRLFQHCRLTDLTLIAQFQC
jgi:hypothetical protein